ncbi:copper-binding protein [Castellaniella sp. S9]|uniref:copper-binding protein n=1 Tax=Castellaniella sp. S9 TaxID=2993652 RepID=UPI0022B587BD|nr:copper-binding protein [Castellaniella sp. S9]
MNKLATLSIAVILTFGMAPAVFAGDGMKMDMNAAGDMKMDMMGMGMATHDTSASHADMDLAEGTVRKVDRQTGMVTLEHGELKNVGMPPMTMAYKTKDAATLQQAKEGGKVKFRLENINGAYVITTLKNQ